MHNQREKQGLIFKQDLSETYPLLVDVMDTTAHFMTAMNIKDQDLYACSSSFLKGAVVFGHSGGDCKYRAWSVRFESGNWTKNFCYGTFDSETHYKELYCSSEAKMAFQ